MEHSAFVDVRQRQGGLHEPLVQDLLAKVPPTRSLQQAHEVAAVAIRCDDAHHASLLEPRLLVAQDVGVVQVGQQSHLAQGGFPLALGLACKPDLLQHIQLAFHLVLDEVRDAEGSLSNLTHHAVLVSLCVRPVRHLSRRVGLHLLSPSHFCLRVRVACPPLRIVEGGVFRRRIGEVGYFGSVLGRSVLGDKSTSSQEDLRPVKTITGY
mmetsp:Transcript_26679/g.42727  ORF Transcript_26679/g.42727 Transcript_26679/m.42727 type:complete len:209 (-) Transcript_26679:1331-1957(-)